MNSPSSSAIIINGKAFSLLEIEREVGLFSKNEVSVRAKLFSFICDWFNDQPTLKLQTSGTTGAPKEITVEKSKMQESARMTGDFFYLKEGDTALLCLSPDFVAGKMMIVRAIELKLNLIVSDDFGHPLDGINQKVNFAAMVPLQVSNIFKKDPNQFQIIDILIIGGSGISSNLENQLQGVKTRCWHTYAMTETLSHVALRKINGSGKSEWFQPLPGVSISIDERDCIIIDAPKLSDERIFTNDIATLNGNKFKVLGRIDDVIISAGNKLHPALIEMKLESILPAPYFIGAEEHPEAGKNLVLFIEGSGKEVDLNDLQAQFAKVLPRMEIPRKIVFKKEFKYLESGKIDRAKTKTL